MMDAVKFAAPLLLLCMVSSTDADGAIGGAGLGAGDDGRSSAETSATLDGESEAGDSFKAAVELELQVRDVNGRAPRSDPATAAVSPGAPSGVKTARKPRAAPEELSYAVAVAEDARIGDFIFTVPDHRFARRWFELLPGAESPVRVDRDSGRLSLGRKMTSDAEVLLKIHSLGASGSHHM